MTEDHREIWEKRKVAKFLNSSYEYVENMPYDEFLLCRYLLEIDSLCKSEEGLEVLKNNIRYSQTEPEVDKLRKKYGKEG
nr:MAG TPA: hypothetical protein [Caudoviricetes sp.]